MKFTSSTSFQILGFSTLFLFFGLLMTTSVGAQTQTCQFPPLKELKSGSAVSTYVYHFWEYAHKQLGQKFKGSNYIQNANGQVVGDYHFKNLGAYYSTKQKRPLLAIIDLDDSGVANQFADLLKFLIFIKEDYKSDLFTADAMMAYASGLSNENDENLVPAFINQNGKLDALLKILSDQNDASFFRELNKKYTLKKVSNGGSGLKKEKGLLPMAKLEEKLKSVKKDPEFLSIQSKLADLVTHKIGDILDRGFQINESGSSMNAIRFIYLVQTHNGPAIIELKELTCAGTVKYQEQYEQKVRFEDNKVNLDSEEYWKDSSVVSVSNYSFLFRTKVDNPIQDLLSANAKKDLKSWVMFYAYTLGRIHRNTAQAEYVKKLEQKVKDERELENLTKKMDEFVSEYLVELKKSLK